MGGAASKYIIISLVEINKLIMQLVFYLFVLLAPVLSPAPPSPLPPYIDTYNPASPVNPVAHTYAFVGGSGKDACQIQLTFTPGTKLAYSALLVASISSSSLVTSLSSYIHINPLDTTLADLENANKGQTQTVQVTGLIPGNNVYIKVVVFDTTASAFSWTITVTEQQGLVQKCPPIYSKPPNPSSQYCINCLNLPNYGAYCSISDTGLSNSSQITRPILSRDYVAFTIPGASNQINFQFSADQPNVEVFIQFKTYSTEIAGLVNCAVSPAGIAAYMIGNATSNYQVKINSGGSDVSVGVINQGPNTANFSTQYSTQTPLNILVIVLGILGGLLLIALIVAAFFIIRRIRSPTQIIHPQASGVGRQSLNQQNMLTNQQIEMYFPSVSCRIAFTSLQSSSLNLNSKEQSVDRDCVICLCAIDGNELMKVTYCRHLFHAHCLVEWFKKQRNCPYCRQEYSKSSTVEHYQHLLTETKRNMLAGVDLAHQILKSKARSTVIIEDVKD